MSKKLNTDQLANELEQSAFFRKPGSPPEQSPTQIGTPTVEEKKVEPVNQSVDQSISQSTKRENSQVVERPKAFYITKRLDRRLDEAVRYLQEKRGIKKVDRSVLVNAILDNDAFWTEKALDLLVDRVISQLTSRLTG